MRAVPLLIAANVLVFVLVGAGGAGWMDADGRALIRWGSNFGPLTADGQWWRLLTAMFLHGGLVHLGVNMLTLADVGRLCERLHGTFRFLLLYFVSGLLGSAASVWWNPSVNSVGASGALFGVLGATLVYMLDKRNAVPPAAMKAHVATLGVFVVYGLANGFASKGIDNFAHLGGLVGGLVCGWALAPRARSDWRAIGGLAACVLAIAGLALATPNTRADYDTENRFLQDIEWLRSEEQQLNDEARRVFARAREPGARNADLKPSVERLEARWTAAHARLSAYEVRTPPRLHDVHGNMVEFLDLRRRAMRELVLATDEGGASKAHMDEYGRLMKEANAVAGRMSGKENRDGPPKARE